MSQDPTLASELLDAAQILLAPDDAVPEPPPTEAVKLHDGMLIPGRPFWRHRMGYVTGPHRCYAVRLNEAIGAGYVQDDRGNEWNRLECYLRPEMAHQACATYWRRVAHERQLALDAAKEAILSAEANADRARSGAA